MRNLRLFVGVFLLVVLFAIPSALQAQTASVAGTLTDATGAGVPEAKVTARNTNTNSARSTQTGDTGWYRITNLLPGLYEVVFEKQGFQILRYSNINLTVDQILTLDAKIEVSPVSQTVEVNGQMVAPVELDNAQISNVVDQRRITDLPLIVRDPYQLILLSPGVVQSNSGLGGFSVNGQRERQNNFLLDGVDNNDTEVPGIPGGITSLNPDSTQEFRVITNNFLPEFGRNTGAVIDVVTKSGSNGLHGDVYWFGRYAALGARDFFNHDPGTPKAPYVRNDFGASAGGPFIKNRTFWFANYEGQRFVTALINTSVVSTAAFKTGKFTFNGTLVDISSPSSPQNATGLPLDPTIQKILALYPSPNAGSVDDVRGLFHFNSSSRQQSDNGTVRIDHRFSDKHSLFGRYVINRFEDPNPFHTDFLPGLDSISTFQRTQNLSLTLTSTFTPNLINELRVGGNRTNLQFNCNGISTFDSLGPLDPFGRGRDYTLSGLNTFGCGSLGDSNGQARFTGTYTVSDTFTWVRGKHSWKVGGEGRDVYANSFTNFFIRTNLDFDVFSIFGAPSINLDPANPCNPSDPNPNNFAPRCGSTTLQNMGWLLTGVVGSTFQAQFFDKARVRQGDNVRGFRQREARFFGQDVWKVTPHLTLNYGLVWQFFGVPFEVNDNLSTLFADPSGPAPFTFTVLHRGSGQKLYHDSLNDWEPRIGVAWDPFKKGKTSVRAGFGMFHDRTFGNLFTNARGNPPFEQDFQDFPGDILPNVGIPPQQVSSLVVNNGAFIEPVIFDQKFQNPQTYAWNLGIQQDFFQSLAVEVNYVGNHSIHLFRQVDGNPPQPALVAARLAAGVPASALQFSSLYFGRTQSVVNNAFFHVFTQKSTANSSYNGLQVKVTKRMSHGLEIQGAYTWSHAIDDASDPLVPGAANRSFPRNSFDLRAERGNSDFDVRHRAVINYIYEFPVGRGKGHLKNGFLGAIFEGWQLSGITTFSSGLPFDIFGNRDNQHTGLSDRPDEIGNPFGPLPAGTDARTHTGPVVTAFARAPFGRKGNVGRNIFTAPGINNFDMVLQKTTTLTDRLKLDLRSEFYNVFNRVQFFLPGTSIASPGTFGVSFLQVGRSDGTSGARQVQFALKLKF